MTILGGRSRRKLRGVTLVVSHQDAWTTEWIITQSLEGIHEAQGPSCPVTIFILSDDDVSQQIQIASELYEVISESTKNWIPRVFVSLRDADAVIVSGIEANKIFAKNLRANLLYLPILVDSLDKAPHFLPGHAGDLDCIARASKLSFFNSEMSRSTAESVAPAFCERTLVLKPGSLELKQKSNFYGTIPNLIQPLVSLTPAVQEFLESLHGYYREMGTPPRTIITGAERDEQFFLNGDYGDTRFLPGIEFHSRRHETLNVGASITIVDDVSFDNRLMAWSMKESLQLGAFPLALSRIDTSSLISVLNGNNSLPSEEWAFPIPSTHGTTLKQGVCQALRPRELSSSKETNVVLAGSDFKFASALVRELDAASDIRFVVDRVVNNSAVSHSRSMELADWADVVVVEFLNEQAVWYSRNLSRQKRLIVHMHGFELYGSFADRLNLDGVAQIVVPSEGYKAKVIELRGWPENKLRVIHNSGSLDDLVRPKNCQARFTLGLVGWVPSLKRIDRALDLLEQLIEVDDRYALEVRGAPPWDYTWEWNTPAHRDTYIEVLRRLKTNAKLANHVTFSPFSPDVGNWLRGIGWVLSPSSRESFHLAPVEGMLSGAVPIVWQREGAADIFGAQWIVENAEMAQQRIIAANDTHNGWTQLSQRAADESAERYSETTSRRQWHEIIVKDANSGTSEHSISTPQKVEPSQIRSVVLAEQGEFLAAWEEIQRRGNEALEVSRSFGLAHSAWVRGHIRLPNKLLALQHGARQISTNSSSSDTSIVVQVAALGRDTPREFYGGASLVLVKPPAGSPEVEKYVPSYFSNFEPLVPILGPDLSKALTLEEHIEIVAKQLVDEAKKMEIYNFRVDGPYWAVLAALLAAVEVGGGVDWDLSVHAALNTQNIRPNTKIVTDDPLEMSSIVLSEMLERVLINPNKDYPPAILAMFDTNRIIPADAARQPGASIKLNTLDNADNLNILPKVTIILPSYRTDGSLLRALDSIYAQTYPLHKLQVQVILNGRGITNKAGLDEYITQHRGPEWRILESEVGVVAARNKGLSAATGDYVTFIDDDDSVERNYIAAMVAMAAPNLVVAADMTDIDEAGRSRDDTNAVRRAKAIGFERVPAYTRAGLFGACGAKLIPLNIIGKKRFDPNLTSGEDVAFLGELVAREDLGLVSAHRMNDAAYIRTMSKNSISRPVEVDAQFAIVDRLQVAHIIYETMQISQNTMLISTVENTLIKPQITLMLTAVKANPILGRDLVTELQAYNVEFINYLRVTFGLSEVLDHAKEG